MPSEELQDENLTLNSRVNHLLSQITDDTSRISTGESIIFQNELSSIFEICSLEMSHLENDYLKSIMLEYIRQAKENDLTIQPKLQQVLWKTLWRNRDFVGLQNIIQFKVIEENLELAQKLVELGMSPQKPYYWERAMDVGIQMLYKLNEKKQIAVIYIKNQ